MPLKDKEAQRKANREARAKERLELKSLRQEVQQLRAKVGDTC